MWTLRKMVTYEVKSSMDFSRDSTFEMYFSVKLDWKEGSLHNSSRSGGWTIWDDFWSFEIDSTNSAS